MRNSKTLMTVLTLAGLIAVATGSALLFGPAAFNAKNGIEIGDNVSSLSEARALGGALLAMGVLITAGAFVTRLTFTSVVMSSLLYLSFGLARLVSMAVDGIPADGLVQAAAIELVVGAVSVLVLVRFRERARQDSPGRASA